MTMVACDVADTVERLRRDVAKRPSEAARLGPSTVLALDVLYHALMFVEHPEGLSIWRTALWEGRLEEPGVVAITALLEHLNAAVAAGEAHRVTEICDCLEELMDPNAVPRERVGGLALPVPG